MPDRRTTVTADQDDLALLAEVARQRGVSLALVLGEAVAEKAREVRLRRRRAVATFHAEVSIAEEMAVDPDGAAGQAFR